MLLLLFIATDCQSESNKYKDCNCDDANILMVVHINSFDSVLFKLKTERTIQSQMQPCFRCLTVINARQENVEKLYIYIYRTDIDYVHVVYAEERKHFCTKLYKL